MQSGLGKSDKWLIEFETENAGINPLMGWESNSNTLSELNLEFSSKELAIQYAKKNKIDQTIHLFQHRFLLEPTMRIKLQMNLTKPIIAIFFQ